MTGAPASLRTVADGLLELLARRGVEYLFANSGTDFPPIVESLARAVGAEAARPRAILVPHENVAVGMAYGHTMVSGRPQAVMVHVNVGTANALCGLINAARENVPILLAAGRTPIHESGPAGRRSLNIHWAQEMFDQAGIVREHVKWDYELRSPEQLETVIDRAFAVALSEPQGPVYLTLPREVLAAPFAGVPQGVFAAPADSPAPAPAAIAQAAALLVGAEHPLIVTARAGRNVDAVALLERFAGRYAIPVVEFRPRYLALSTEHPMHGGFEVDPWLDTADVILVLDCDVPWIPALKRPRNDARVIQAGVDPLFARYPIRGFPSAVTVTAPPGMVIDALDEALGRFAGSRLVATRLDRASRVAAARASRADAARALLERAEGSTPMGMAWVAHCLSRAAGEDAIYVNEYPLVRSVMRTTRPGSFFGSSPVGGLGWGLPAALGAQLAAPDRLVVCATGDGSYLFANPIACHQAAAAIGLPVLTVVFNNGGYGAVERATRAMYPEGRAVQSGRMPLAWFDATVRLDQVAAACGAHAERVASADALPGALERALDVVRRERRQAMLDVLCA
jgi:acetolactate synthase-1/2/3 large subunit